MSTYEDLVEQANAGAEPPLPIGRFPFEFLCGTAGTGKTYMARQLVGTQPGVKLAATTGIAAVNLGEGTTIHALLRFFNTGDLEDKYTKGILQTQIRHQRRAGLRRIVLDEVSMLNAKMLTLLTRAIDEVNTGQYQDVDLERDAFEEVEQRADPTEGEPIGLTLVGDFGQLPPVPDTNERTGAKMPVQFAFESPEWERYAAHVTKLEKIWRQDAQDFVQALHAVRKADVTKALAFFTPERFTDQMETEFAGTTIVAKNIEVDRINQLRLDTLAGAVMRHRTIRTGKQRGDWKQIPEVTTVKEGALVMLLANRRVYDDDGDSHGRIVYANGDLATVLGQDASTGNWMVKLQRTGEEVPVLSVIRENTIPLEPGRRKELKAEHGTDWVRYITEDGKHEIVGTVLYMPIRLAYACTVHKTQGLTLDTVQINLRDPFFKHPGMAFVALSRARTAEGLRIVGSQRMLVERCKIDPRVIPWL